MFSGKGLIAANVTLALIALLLLLNLGGISLPSVGKARFLLDKHEPVIMVGWKNQYAACPDILRCCAEAAQQLRCSPEQKTLLGSIVNEVCQTGTGEVLQYWLNNKAYYYCQEQVFWK